MALTKEDLQAIGSLMDMKLEPISQRIDETNRQVSGLSQRIDETNRQVSVLSQRIDETNERIDETNKQVGVLSQRIDETNKRIDETNSTLAREVGTLRREIGKVHVLIESDVMHKIQLIAESHSSLVSQNTYIRRKVDKMDDMSDSIFALESCVREHHALILSGNISV